MSYVTDVKKFEKLSQSIQPVLNWHLKIIDADVHYLDWYVFMDKNFPEFLNALTQLSGDEDFYFRDLYVGSSQEKIDEYYEHFNQFPLIRFPNNVMPDHYLAALNKEYVIKDYYKSFQGKNEDRYYIFAATSAYVIFPESMKWHIFAEYNFEIARLVTTVGLPKILPPGGFVPENEAKQLIAANMAKKQA